MVTAGKTDNNVGRYGKSASAQVDQRFDFVYGFLYGTAVTANYFGGTLAESFPHCRLLQQRQQHFTQALIRSGAQSIGVV